MKRLMSIMAMVLAVTCTLAPVDAHAKKFGGGKSFGRSYNTTQSQPNTPASRPNQQNYNQSQTNKTNAEQPQQQKKSGLFGGMMGGLFGGLLAGTLLGSLFGGGLGSGIGGLIGILLIAGLGFLAFKLFKRKREHQLQGAGANTGGSSFGSSLFGNDSNSSVNSGTSSDGFRTDNFRSAQPHQEDSHSSFKGESKFGDGYRNDGCCSSENSSHTSSVEGGFGAGNEVPFTLPPDFDLTGFVRRARDHYRIIQEAWNRNDMSTIKEYVSAELYELLVAERNSLQGDQHTEVMYVDAEVVRADYAFGKAEVSLRFSGRYRDNVERIEENIDDIWHLAQARAGAPWLITGIEHATQ